MAGGALKWVLNVWLVPGWGITGAALATVLAFAAVACLNLRRIWSKGWLTNIGGVIARLCWCSLLMVFFLLVYMKLWQLFVPVSRAGAVCESLSASVIGGLLFIYCMIRMKIFTDEELSGLPFGSALSKLKKRRENMAGNITVVGLGAGDMDQLTVGVHKSLTQAKHLYIRTKDHPLIPELEQETEADIRYFDDIYEKHDQFEAVYEEIADILFEKAKQEDVVYAVPGHPFVAEKTVQLLFERREEQQVAVHTAGGQSFWMPLLMHCELIRLKGFNLRMRKQ